MDDFDEDEFVSNLGIRAFAEIVHARPPTEETVMLNGRPLTIPEVCALAASGSGEYLEDASEALESAQRGRTKALELRARRKVFP